MAQVAHEKDTCLHHESWNKKAGHHCVWPQLGTCTGDFSMLCTCPSTTMKAPWVSIWGLQINLREKANSQIWNLQWMKISCAYVTRSLGGVQWMVTYNHYFVTPLVSPWNPTTRWSLQRRSKAKKTEGLTQLSSIHPFIQQIFTEYLLWDMHREQRTQYCLQQVM